MSGLLGWEDFSGLDKDIRSLGGGINLSKSKFLIAFLALDVIGNSLVETV